MTADQQRWRVWDSNADMAELYYQRAVGNLPEMESAKAAARRLQSWVRPGDRILDVGCGAGHYLRSLRRVIPQPFSYTGVDATPLFVETARRAWAHDSSVSFQLGDAFALPFADAEFDLVMCSNMLLHLPSIERPLSELVRVARRHVLIRTLIGDRSFRVQEVRGPAGEAAAGAEEFDEQGNPRNFNFYNIYSRPYVERILRALPRVRQIEISRDEEFDAQAVLASAAAHGGANATAIIAGWQVNGYILQPWHFVAIELSA